MLVASQGMQAPMFSLVNQRGKRTGLSALKFLSTVAAGLCLEACIYVCKPLWEMCSALLLAEPAIGNSSSSHEPGTERPMDIRMHLGNNTHVSQKPGPGTCILVYHIMNKLHCTI